MKTRTLTAIAAIAALAVYSAWVTVENATLRRRMAELEARPSAVVRRPRMKDAPPPRPQRMRTETRVGASDQKIPPAPGGERISDEAVDKAVAARIAALKKDAEEARERRREAIASLTPEQKAAQRDMFLERMHERAQRRLETFVSRTGLSAEQRSSFENTIAAIDATLRETAEAWAEQIRKTGTFTRDAQVKFVGEVSNVLGAGYGQMDSTLPEDWRKGDGDVNLMEVVGPDALSSMVEALTESGNEDGLRTIGQVMGGPEGGPEGAGGEDAQSLQGIESPGVGGGPGSGPGGGPGGQGGAMGGPGGGAAPPAAR